MTKSIEETITKAFRERFSPEAILLHGSRSTGWQRARSDWDIIVLCIDPPTDTRGREIIAGECVEWKAFPARFSEQEILRTFGTYLQSARVLWEAEKLGSDLLRMGTRVYTKGPQLTREQRDRESIYFWHKIDGMRDDLNDPTLFFRHTCVLFGLATKLWFEILHNEFGKPLYIAMPRIRKDDPTYGADLDILVGSYGNDAKAQAAERLGKRLFQQAPVRHRAAA